MMKPVYERNRQLHLLIFPFPGLSHILPACYLAKKLTTISQGNGAPPFFITFLCPLNVVDPPTVRLLTQDPNINVLPFPDEKGFVVERLVNNSSSSSRGDQNVYDVLIEFSQASFHLRDPFERLMQNLMHQQPPVCCIISDQFLSWTQNVADSYGIPRYILDTSPAELVALIFYVKELRDQGRLPLSSPPSATLTIPGLVHARPSRSCFSCLLDTDPPYLHEFFKQNFSRVHDSAGTLINTFYELEPEAVEALVTSPGLNPNKVGVWPVGPLLPPQLLLPSTKMENGAAVIEAEDINPVSRICMQWLENQSASSVLYVSFGSIFRGTVAQIEELALGLEATNQSFLWVLHSPPAATAPASAAPKSDSFTTRSSSKGLPEGFELRVAGRGLVLSSWVPQKLILRHPSTGGFMTHCGWNSTLESITMGVPTIAVPKFGDQRTNCRLMVELWRTGIEAQVREVDGLLERREVERVVRHLMDSPEGVGMRQRAKELGDLAKKAVASGGSSEANLQVFARHLHYLHSTPVAHRERQNPRTAAS